MAKSKSIKLSPKYGVNPSLSECFFCGKTKLLFMFGKIGKGKTDIEAPQHAIYDYEPCDDCKKLWEGKTVVIGCVTEQPADKRSPIARSSNGNLYPTGSYVVMEREAVRKIFNMEPKQVMFAEESVVVSLHNRFQELKAEQEKK
jgi:hypothetical protein